MIRWAWWVIIVVAWCLVASYALRDDNPERIDIHNMDSPDVRCPCSPEMGEDE